MSEFQSQYKKKSLGFGDQRVSRVVRAGKQNQARKTCRIKTFNKNRNLQNTPSHSSGSTLSKEEPPEPEDLETRLLKWKEKKQAQKEIEKMKIKKAFVVRAVDKNIFSLPKNSKVAEKPTKSTTVIPKKITKATEKRLMRKEQLSKVVNFPSESPQPAPEKKCNASKCENNNLKPSDGLDEAPLFGRVHLAFEQLFKKNINSSNIEMHKNDNSFKSENVDIDNEPIFFSPYVVSRRGKSNARNEERMKRGFSLNHSLGDDIPTKDTVMKNLNISIEEEERTAQYFQFLLSKEVDRLKELCDKWTVIKEEPDTTEDGQHHINQAVGQTNLLISKKFERFRRLVTDCETGKGEMLVTCKDLQGFWDMMYMEIKNCDSRFVKLEQIRSLGWKEEEVYNTKKLPAKKKATVNKKAVLKKASSVTSFIREKSKKIMEEAANTNDKKHEILGTKSKTRRSIGPSDNKLSSTNKHIKKRSSLLQKVQISATKKLDSLLTIMKISKMCKTPEVQLDSTTSYINSDQTPGKSILKQPKKSNEIESCTKSSHKVNFNDTVVFNEVPIDEETQTKMQLVAALARIDSLEFDDSIEDMPMHVEKILVFDDSSADESENVFDTNEEIKSITETINITPVEIQGATSIKPPTRHDKLIPPSPRKRLRRQSALAISDKMLDIVSSPSTIGIVSGVDLNVTRSLDSEEETHGYNESIRVLRNRSITSSNIPTLRRSKKMSTNNQELEYKENINSKDDLSNDTCTIILNEKNKTRKTRRSIQFSEDVCNTYREKTAFPVTPHVRRRTISANSKSTDLPIPERIRRLNR